MSEAAGDADAEAETEADAEGDWQGPRSTCLQTWVVGGT
jgi:hypothetical protein